MGVESKKLRVYKNSQYTKKVRLQLSLYVYFLYKHFLVMHRLFTSCHGYLLSKGDNTLNKSKDYKDDAQMTMHAVTGDMHRHGVQ